MGDNLGLLYIVIYKSGENEVQGHIKVDQRNKMQGVKD